MQDGCYRAEETAAHILTSMPRALLGIGLSPAVPIDAARGELVGARGVARVAIRARPLLKDLARATHNPIQNPRARARIPAPIHLC